MKILFAMAVLVLFNSCKMNKNDDTNTSKGIGDFQINQDQVLTSGQIKIIKEICNNLKSKRDYFNTLDDMKVRFNFHNESLSCDGKTKTEYNVATLLSNTSSTDLEYYVDRDDYLRNVITDQTSGIKLLCDNVNALNLKNTFYDSNLSFAFDALIVNGYNRLIMIKSVKDNNGAFIPKVGEGIDMVVNTYQAPKNLLGMENERMRSTKCSNGKITYTKQTWVR